MNTDNGAESFSIHLDNSQLEREAARAASLIEGIGEKAIEEGRRIDKALDELPKKIEEQEKKVEELTDKYEAQSKAIDELDKQLLEHKELLELDRKEVEQAQKAYDEAKEKQGAWTDTTKRLQQQLEDAKEGYKKEQEAIRDLNLEKQQERQTQKEINDERKKEQQNLKDLQGEYKKTQKEAKDLSRTISEAVKKHQQEAAKVPTINDQIAASMKTIGKLSAGYLTVAGAKKFISTCTEVRKELEQLELQFSGLFGEAEGAELLGGLKGIALDSGLYKTSGLAQAAETLNIYGEKTEEILPLVREFGDIAMGNEQKMNSLATAIGWLNTQGTLNSLTLRTLLRAGFNPLEEMARTTGKSMEQLNAEMKAGMITTQMVKDAMRSATSEGGKFYNMTEKLGDSIAGEQGKLSMMISGIYAEWGKEHEDFIKGGYKLAQSLVANYDTIGKTIAVLIATYGTYRAALIATAAAETALNAGYVTKIRLLRLAVTAQQTLNRVMMMNPYAMAAAALVGLTSAIIAFSKESNTAAGEIERVKERQDEQAESAEKLRNEINQNINAINDETKSEGDRQDALNTLKSLLPSVFEKYDTWIDLQKDLAAATAAANEQLAIQNNVTLGKNIDHDKQMLADLKKYRDELNKIGLNGDKLRALKIDLVKKYPELFGIDTNSKLYKERPEAFANVNFKDQGTFETTWHFVNGKIQEVTKSVAGLNEQLAASTGKQWDALLPKKTLAETNDQLTHYEELLGRLHEQQTPLALQKRWESQNTGYLNFTTALHPTAANIEQMRNETNTVVDPLTGEVLTAEELERRIKESRRHANTITANANRDFLADAKAAYEAAQKAVKDIIDNRNNTDANGNRVYPTEQAYQEALRQAREIEKQKKAVYEQMGGSTKQDTRDERAAEQARRKAELERIRREEGEEKAEAERRKWAEQDAKLRAEGELLAAQAEIDAMDEGEAKKLAQLELNKRRELLQIEQTARQLYIAKVEHEKALWDADPKNKGNDFYKAHAYDENTGTYNGIAQLTKDELDAAGISARINSVLANFGHERDQILQESRQLMYDYLQEYGSLQEQKAAIAAEYDEKIAKSQNAWERRSLEAQRDGLIGEADFKALQNSIDWEDVFSDIGSHTTAYLTDLKEKLRKALDAKDITAENAKVLAEKIREIEDTIAGKTDIWSAILPGLRERKRITQETAIAEQAWVKALNEEAVAINKVLADKTEIQSKLNTIGITVELEEIDEENRDRLLASLDQGTPLYNGLLELFKNLAADQSKVKQTHEQSQQKKSALDAQWDKLKNLSSLTDIFSWATGNPLGILQGINQNAQSMGEFVDKIGLENTDFGQAVHGFADATGGFTSAVQSLLSGDIFGAVNGVLDGIAGFAKMGIHTLIGGGNEEEKESEIAQLTESQERLIRAIDDLSEKILKSDSTNAQSVEYYRNALQAEKDWEQKQRQKIDARAGEYANSGYGFLGLGGKHSFNANMASNSWAGWQTFSNILKQHQGEAGVTHSSVNRDSIWNLTPEEMKLLRDFAPKEWEALFNTDGHKNPEDLVNEYIERAGTQDELTSALNEKLTGYDWEGFLKSYKDLLKDLDSTTEDFADHINELITNALIESFVNEELQKDIDELYKYIAEAAMDGIDAQEQARIDKMNEDIANKGLAWRQQMVDAGMIKPDSESYSQNGSRNSLAGMSQDQGEEMNGRLTSVQVAVYGIFDEVKAQSVNQAAIARNAASISSTMNDLIDLQTDAVDYLQKIERHTSVLPAMRADIAKIKSNTAALTTKK